MRADAAAWPSMRRDEKSAKFFDAAARGDLAIRRCTSCSASLAPEAGVCTRCGETSLEWARATGAATLVAWTVVHRAPSRAYGDLVPYVVGLVEIAEGPWLYARLDVESPRSAMDLDVTFVTSPDGESHPVFVEAATSP